MVNMICYIGAVGDTVGETQGEKRHVNKSGESHVNGHENSDVKPFY